MGKTLDKEFNNGLNYFIDKTLFFMEKTELIEDEIETWFREGIILNKVQLEKVVTKADNKSIKYIKKSKKRYINARKKLENEILLEEKHKFYNNYVNTYIKVLSEIAEDENRNELLNRDVEMFMNEVKDKVTERIEVY